MNNKLQEANRKNNFNVVHILAAVAIIYGHMYPIMATPVTTVGGQAVSTLAVKTLFIVSGYLVTLSYERDPNFVRYFIKRVFRIFPALIFLTFVTLFIAGPILSTLEPMQYFKDPGTYQYLKNAIACPVYNLPGVFANNAYPGAVNGSLWTLPVELFLYLLLVPFLMLPEKYKRYVILAVALIFQILNIIKIKYFPTSVFVVYNTNVFDTLTLAPYFFMGSFFTSPKIKKYLNLQVAILATSAFLLLRVSEVKAEIGVFLILPYLVLSLSLCENPVFCNCFVKNDFAYGIYLYGFLVQQTLQHYLARFHLSLNIMFILSLTGSVICAAISFYLVEKPCAALSKKIVTALKHN